MRAALLALLGCAALALGCHGGTRGTGAPAQENNKNNHHDRVPLKEATQLVLHKGEFAAGRRSSGVPQMVCHGEACHQDVSTRAVCTQTGSDGLDPVWQCTLDPAPPLRLKLRSFHVSCEGYDYPNDPYVLRHSCGLEYELAFTAKEPSFKHYEATSSVSATLANLVFAISVIILLIVLAVTFCALCPSRTVDPNETPLYTAPSELSTQAAANDTAHGYTKRR